VSAELAAGRLIFDVLHVASLKPRAPAPPRAVRCRAGVAPTREMAEEVCLTGCRQRFDARLPHVREPAGGVAFMLDEVMPASPAYRRTLNHTMRIDDPMELFPVRLTEAGVG
jgi:hypothetical protein